MTKEDLFRKIDKEVLAIPESKRDEPRWYDGYRTDNLYVRTRPTTHIVNRMKDLIREADIPEALLGIAEVWVKSGHISPAHTVKGDTLNPNSGTRSVPGAVHDGTIGIVWKKNDRRVQFTVSAYTPDGKPEVQHTSIYWELFSGYLKEGRHSLDWADSQVLTEMLKILDFGTPNLEMANPPDWTATQPKRRQKVS